jgi:hypothetical protein
MPTTETLIVIGGITIASLLWLIVPFFGRDQQTQNAINQKQLERLLMYYEQVMATLRDLEEDHITGKIAEADYQEEREAWAARGVKVLGAINEVAAMDPVELPKQSTAKRQEKVESYDDIDAAIEAAVSKALSAK